MRNAEWRELQISERGMLLKTAAEAALDICKWIAMCVPGPTQT